MLICAIRSFDSEICEQFQVYKQGKKYTSMIYTNEKVSCNHFCQTASGFFKIRNFIKNREGFYAVGYKSDMSNKVSKKIVHAIYVRLFIFFLSFDLN